MIQPKKKFPFNDHKEKLDIYKISIAQTFYKQMNEHQKMIHSCMRSNFQ